MNKEKSKRRQTYRLLSILLGLPILAIAAPKLINALNSSYALNQQENTLAHFLVAESMPIDTYKQLQPAQKKATSLKILKPQAVEFTLREDDFFTEHVLPSINNFVDSKWVDKNFDLEYEETLIYDQVTDIFYHFDELDFALHQVTIEKLLPGSQKAVAHNFPFDERWKERGGFACFSCGCSCYMDKELMIVGGQHVVHVYGKNDAIHEHKQGLYVLNKQGDAWTKLTPKLDSRDDVKLINNGCEVAYLVNEQAFRLNLCEQK